MGRKYLSCRKQGSEGHLRVLPSTVLYFFCFIVRVHLSLNWMMCESVGLGGKEVHLTGSGSLITIHGIFLHNS